MKARVEWRCAVCGMTGHREHDLPLVLTEAQGVAWDEHRMVNQPCDDSMDLETFHIVIGSIHHTAEELAAFIDARLEREEREMVNK